MHPIQAHSTTPAVTDWLSQTHRPRFLHIFENTCNLINEHREVLSIVTPEIGNGPFNLVIGNKISFPEYINIKSPIYNSPDHLHLGQLSIRTADANLWNPRPDWEALYIRRENICKQSTNSAINQSSFSNPQFSNVLIAGISSAFVAADITTAKSLAAQVAGLGIGLTPSGDDFLMGALYAAWTIHPREKVEPFAKEIAESAAPLTTSLSAAWLKSAGRGEAGISWHEFFDAMIFPNSDLEPPISKILSSGHTSGADALAGFFSVYTAFNSRIIGQCPS